MANDLKIPVGTILNYEARQMETPEPHVVVKLPGGKQVEYRRRPDGKIGRQELGPDGVKDEEFYPWTRLDMSQLEPGQPFPWKVPYTNLGFMGALSGSGGTMTIHEDGHIERKSDWIS
jgi:hypothetical protein